MKSLVNCIRRQFRLRNSHSIFALTLTASRGLRLMIIVGSIPDWRSLYCHHRFQRWLLTAFQQHHRLIKPPTVSIVVDDGNGKGECGCRSRLMGGHWDCTERLWPAVVLQLYLSIMLKVTLLSVGQSFTLEISIAHLEKIYEGLSTIMPSRAFKETSLRNSRGRFQMWTKGQATPHQIRLCSDVWFSSQQNECTSRLPLWLFHTGKVVCVGEFGVGSSTER